MYINRKFEEANIYYLAITERPKFNSKIAISFASCHCFDEILQKQKFSALPAVLALREVWESETPKNCPGTSKIQCQEVWDSQILKISAHL